MNRSPRRIPPGQQQLIVGAMDRVLASGVSNAVSVQMRASCDTGVRKPMRIRDEIQGGTQHTLQLRTSFDQSAMLRLRLQSDQRVVVPGVEADLGAPGGEGTDLISVQSLSHRLRAE
jgi:hypothetical protein